MEASVAAAEPTFEYSFPSIRGIQAGREYYVSQCPLRLVPKLFQFDDTDLPPEVRAQRTLNRARVPEMADYLLRNRDSYVFSALTASVDSELRFDPLPGEPAAARIGILRIPMEARFIINDGQHRRAAIELAIAEDPDLGDETIAIVFFVDLGLERCQQMFADLNRHAVRPSASIGVLYDHRDAYAVITRSLVAQIPLFRDVVEMEKTSLAKQSRKLVTLSAIHTAVRALLPNVDLDDIDGPAEVAREFFEAVAAGFPEWTLVQERELRSAEVREDFIHTYGVVLHAIGRVGASMVASGEPKWDSLSKALTDIDWGRRNPAWEGRAMIGGRIAKSSNNVVLTANVVKDRLGIELSPDEREAEDAFFQRDSDGE